jgi:hypothetical protein
MTDIERQKVDTSDITQGHRDSRGRDYGVDRRQKRQAVRIIRDPFFGFDVEASRVVAAVVKASHPESEF